MSGVDIQLIIPRKPDNKDYMLPINRKYCLELIGTNFKIYEYDGFIHSKIIIIDDELLLLGSNNLDYRSLLINFENFLLINSKTSAKQFVEYFDESLTHSIESSKENLKQYMNI
ncbi:hypothetical protein FACS189459_0720 [Bacilli bacterium]|nr:hypothetical protein FACS189459_0720 [Bacilli bacterium]